ADTMQQLHRCTGKALLYLASDSLAESLLAGDQIAIHATMQRLAPSKNPAAFDYAAYMAKKGVYHRAFVASGDWQKLPPSKYNWRRDLFTWQQSCQQILAQHLHSKDAFAIGAALIMGEKGFLDEGIRAAYTNTGAIHVLAVSGLHVGLVYLAISYLLGLVGCQGQRFKWSRSSILLLSVWVFAIFTGASASVLRAATMFSFIILGEALYRNQNIYNTLAASAFLLLCFQPYLLFDVGFQLSYLAVLGIVFFQGRIYRSWYIEHPIGRYLWKLTSVSIAAQLTTLPISLFYFHQFPFYFWLSGWIVVPAAMIILSVGLLLLLFNKVAIISTALGAVLYWIITAMNTLILQIQALPAGLIEGVWLNIESLLLLYLILAFIMFGLQLKQIRLLQLGAVTAILLGILTNVQLWQNKQQQLVAIYAVRANSVIDIFDGTRAYCLSNLSAHDQKLRSAAENFRAAHAVQEVQYFNWSASPTAPHKAIPQNSHFKFGGLSFAIISDLPEHPPPKPVEVDFLILRKNPSQEIMALLPFFKAKTLVFDGSNYKKTVRTWIRDCTILGWDYHDVEQQGAIVIPVNSSHHNPST
ncbi:MAG: ComEC family competence protein, partial [Saprospiraceae bacterium]|nr:ComEC family competence protein [Saprospiraceae bacterium]